MKNELSTQRSASLFLFPFVLGFVSCVAEPTFSSRPVGQSERPPSASALEDYKARAALKAYEERNAEIDSWMEDPYTNRKFSYKITEDCFDLGCRSDVFKKGKQVFTFSIYNKKN